MATNIRDKIAKLLALGESPNENEAKQAILKARALMAEHKLRPEEIEKAEDVKVVNEHVNVTCTAMTDPWTAALSGVIAAHYCCVAYRTRQHGRKVVTVGFIGVEDDFEICKRIFLYAYDCVKSYCKREIERNPWEPSGTYREKCNAYGWGFVRGVARAFKEQEEQHQEWGLVMVVPQEVTDASKKAGLGKPSSFGREKTGDCIDEYRARGYQDGREFDPGHRMSGAPEKVALAGGCR